MFLYWRTPCSWLAHWKCARDGFNIFVYITRSTAIKLPAHFLPFQLQENFSWVLVLSHTDSALYWTLCLMLSSYHDHLFVTYSSLKICMNSQPLGSAYHNMWDPQRIISLWPGSPNLGSLHLTCLPWHLAVCCGTWHTPNTLRAAPWPGPCCVPVTSVILDGLWAGLPPLQYDREMLEFFDKIF